MKSILYFLILCLWPLTNKVQTPAEKYETYVKENLCTNAKDTSCLRETSYIAKRGDGRKVKVRGVYEWIDDPNDYLFIPWSLRDYMKYLREAYYSDPAYANQLYNQIDFLISKTFDRNGALVWENVNGIAQGMEQARFADYFVTAATAFKYHGDNKNAKGIMTYALKFIRAVDLPAKFHSGGVSSISTNCGAKKARARPCNWYHSRGLGNKSPGVKTVLNQHLHVVQDLIYMYLNVYKSPDLVDSQFGSSEEVLNFLEDKAIGGLYQLAFSEGYKVDAPTNPPNIRQFMEYKRVAVKPTPEHPDGNPLSYYRAYYEFDMSAGIGKPIRQSCHYHTHVLNLVGNIKIIIEENREIFLGTENGWRLYEAVDALLEGKGEPTGKRGSKNAIYQFYRSEGPAYKQRREKCPTPEECPKCELLSADVDSLYSATFD